MHISSYIKFILSDEPQNRYRKYGGVACYILQHFGKEDLSEEWFRFSDTFHAITTVGSTVVDRTEISTK